MTSNAATTPTRESGDPFFKSVATMRMLIKDQSSKYHSHRLSLSSPQKQQHCSFSSQEQGTSLENASPQQKLLAKELQITKEMLDEANRQVALANQKVAVKETLMERLKQQLAAAKEKVVDDSENKKELDETRLLLENKIREEGLLRTKVMRLEAELKNTRRLYEELKNDIAAQKYDEESRSDDDDDDGESSSDDDADEEEVEAERVAEEQPSKKRDRDDDDGDDNNGDEVEVIECSNSEQDAKQARIDSSDDEEPRAEGFLSGRSDDV